MYFTTARRVLALLTASGALFCVALTLASQADAATIYACAKRSGAVRIVAKKVKCKKGEKRYTWDTEGARGTNGANGANGTNGVPGQPQSAVTFSAICEGNASYSPLFSLAGVSVRLGCSSYITSAGSLEATGPSGTQARSGMVYERANHEASEFERSVFNVPVSGETPFAELSTNTTGAEKAVVGHVSATITTPGAVVIVDAIIEARNPTACTASGVAFSIPT
jgi:hypothetical protein